MANDTRKICRVKLVIVGDDEVPREITLDVRGNPQMSVTAQKAFMMSQELFDFIKNVKINEKAT